MVLKPYDSGILVHQTELFSYLLKVLPLLFYEIYLKEYLVELEMFK